MAPGSTIFPLTVSFNNLSIPSLPLNLAGIRIQGVFISPRHVHNQMLQFSALHGIKPIIQTFPMSVSGIEDALKKLGEGRIRYRAVLVA
jgi:D-arabinose 1-dehydrogenase-like Zn-dependent alcohol dehydrogenase